MRADTLEDLLEALRFVARQHGYALTMHGSMRRDIDLVAVPWVEPARTSPPVKLAHAIRDSVNGLILKDSRKKANDAKPHGRMTWTIVAPMLHKLGPDWIDLSVIPPVKQDDTREEREDG